MQERLNEEVRRRERVIRIFPNDESALRLIGALLAEKNDVISIWTNSQSGLPPKTLNPFQNRLPNIGGNLHA